MKKNNLVKRLGIASLCLATAISAFSGIASFETDVALAEVAATDLVTATEGATVKHDLDTTVTNATGLSISSNVAYSATFNTLFNGNTVFKFRFPETYDSAVGYYGDFKFHIEDVTDPNNCFDIVYYTRTTSQTGIYVQWKEEIRAVQGTKATTATWLTTTSTDTTYYAPAFLSNSGSGYGNTKVGNLVLHWNSSGVLSILASSVHNSTANSKNYMNIVARFDGTYNETASNKGCTGKKASMGLPKLSFPNGYKVTVSSNLENDNAKPDGLTDNATDVVFREITTNATTVSYTSSSYQYNTNFSYSGGQKSTLTSADTTDFTSNYTKAYDEIAANTGKALLGWKDAEGALYPTATALTSADISAYDPVFLGFDTINGASVRIDTSEGGKSGIRFMTLFDKAEYKVAKKYIQSFGTLLSYTDDLDLRDFTIANYQTEIDEQSTSIRQKANTTKTFNYDLATGLIGASGQPAYSIAVVDIEDYTKEYSVRGYIEVKYADETTQIIYTDYNEADNSRSIAEVAYKIKTNAAAEYDSYEQAYKDVIDGYADAYVAP